MKNILIIGHSSGVGKALTEKICKDQRVYGTYFKKSAEDSNENVSSHYLNVLDEQINLD